MVMSDDSRAKSKKLYYEWDYLTYFALEEGDVAHMNIIKKV